MNQKRFIDIENLRETDDELRESNCKGFEPGDIVNISEKLDGSSACAAYDIESDSMYAFSRNKTLDFSNTLSGFWNYVQVLDKTPFMNHPTWRVFGEWSGARNKILYDERFQNKWIIYDIYDMESESWLIQDVVRAFCKEANLEYVHVYYEGPFISWNHCRGFMNSPNYGDVQEGVVCKNLTKLNDKENRLPFYLKMVNESFKESKKPRIRPTNDEREKQKEEAQALAESIVTYNRIEKELYKLRNEGLIPDKLVPSDMSKIAKILPKKIYDDCLKEEKEIVMACGEYFGKLCGSITMQIARRIICGE